MNQRIEFLLTLFKVLYSNIKITEPKIKNEFNNVVDFRNYEQDFNMTYDWVKEVDTSKWL